MRKYKKAHEVAKNTTKASREITVKRDRIIVPAFTGSARFAYGHVRSFYLDIDRYFSIKMVPPVHKNFAMILVSHGQRYSIWPQHKYFSTYKGETLEPGTKIEFWALGNRNISVPSFEIEISYLNYPPAMCQDPSWTSYYLNGVYGYYRYYGECSPICQPLAII